MNFVLISEVFCLVQPSKLQQRSELGLLGHVARVSLPLAAGANGCFSSVQVVARPGLSSLLVEICLSEGESFIIIPFKVINQVNPFQNVLVTDWGLFVDFLNKCRVQRLDLRRMLHSSTPEDTWNVMEQEFPGLNHISEVIFPKSSMTDVAKVASAIPCLEKIWATSLTPREVDVGLLSHLQGIHELCLKTLPTKMKLVNGLNLGPSFVPTLTKVVSYKEYLFILNEVFQWFSSFFFSLY